MEIRIICRKENYDKYRSMLEKAGFTITEDANLVFQESDYNPSYFLGKKDHQYEIINYQDVIFIESFGRDIYLYTNDYSYQIKDKLYAIEEKYAGFGFIRINKSQIVNKAYIEKIKPLINSRIKIVLKNKKVLEISRNYLDQFRESIGF